MPGRLGVVQPGVRRQRLMAAVAVAGDERDDLVEALRRQASLQARRVSGLSPRLLAGALLGDGLGAPGGLAEGGRPELVALVPRRASSSATRRSRAAMRSSRSRHPGQVTIAMTPL